MRTTGLIGALGLGAGVGDLGRLKSLLEEGKTSRDGTRVRREDLA